METNQNIHRLVRKSGRSILKRYKLLGSVALAACAVILFFVMLFSVAPTSFPSGEIVTIKKGSGLTQAAATLAQNGYIRSAFLFKVFAVLLSGHRQVQAGDYLFDAPESVVHIAFRMVYGLQDLPKIKVTIVEGLTIKDIAGILKKNIPKFDQQTFLSLAKSDEGYLFPDSYYFYENTTPQQVIDQMHRTFEEKTHPLLLDIQASGHSADEIVTMASIVEREATGTTDREIIAGILWHRIASNMPLQVDPPFYYLLGKDSAHLTVSDLAIDSPYNLYKHTGLPPTPIDSPSLDAITATLHPTATNYLFFLSGRDGKMHYAATFNDHIANRQKYLE